MKKKKLTQREKNRKKGNVKPAIKDKSKGLPEADVEAGNKAVHLIHPVEGVAQIEVEKILIAVAEKHKVNVLVLVEPKKHEWYERNGSLKKFMSDLPPGKFEHVNKFYILNRRYIPSYQPKTQKLTFSTGYSIKLKHKIKLSFFKDKPV